MTAQKKLAPRLGALPRPQIALPKAALAPKPPRALAPKSPAPAADPVPPPAPSGPRLKREEPSENTDVVARGALPKAHSIPAPKGADEHAGWLDAMPAAPPVPTAVRSQPIGRIALRKQHRPTPAAAQPTAAVQSLDSAILLEAESLPVDALRVASPIPPPPKLPREIDFEALIADIPDDDEMLSLKSDRRKRRRNAIALALAFPLVIGLGMAVLAKDAVHEPASAMLKKAHNGVVNACDAEIREANELEKFRKQIAKEEAAQKAKLDAERAAEKKRKKRRR